MLFVSRSRPENSELGRARTSRNCRRQLEGGKPFTHLAVRAGGVVLLRRTDSPVEPVNEVLVVEGECERHRRWNFRRVALIVSDTAKSAVAQGKDGRLGVVVEALSTTYCSESRNNPVPQSLQQVLLVHREVLPF